MASRIYFYSESLGATTTTTTDYSVVKVSLSFLPNASKNYVIFWNGLLDATSTSLFSAVRLQNTTAVVTMSEFIIHFASTNTHVVPVGGMAIYAAGGSPTTQTVEIQLKAETASNTAGLREASILVLELGANDAFVEVPTQSSTTSNTPSAQVTLNFTPPSIGDYTVIGSCDAFTSSGATEPEVRLNNSGTTYSSTVPLQVKVEGTDWVPYVAQKNATSVAASAQTWTIDLDTSVAGNSSSLRNMRIVALRANGFLNAYTAEDRTAHSLVSSTTFVDSTATVTATPPAAALDHFIFGSGLIQASDGTTYGGNKGVAAGTDIGTAFSAIRTGNPSADGCWMVLRKLSPAASSNIWKTQYNRSVGAGTITSREHSFAVLQIQDVGGPASKGAYWPDAIAASTNLTGAVSAIQDDPDAPDANWLTATSATSVTDCRVTFPTPPAAPTGAQSFRLWLRKTTGTPTPTATVSLYQGGLLRADLAVATAITSTTGQVVAPAWDAPSLVTTLDGSDVECRVVSVVGSSLTPGASPAYSTLGTVLTSATMGGGVANDVVIPTHTSGDLLVLHVHCRNTNNDGSMVINTAGWTQGGGSGVMYGGAQNSRAGFGWKIGNGSETVVNITTSGGTTTDRLQAAVYRFTAADGFATTPVANIGTATTGSSVTITMPTVTTSAANQRAVALISMSNSTASASATGATGGTWAESVTESAGTNGTITIQTAPLAAAGTISGGTITITSSVWVCIGFSIIPANVPGAAVNTVEIGAIEWMAQYNVARFPPFQYSAANMLMAM